MQCACSVFYFVLSTGLDLILNCISLGFLEQQLSGERLKNIFWTVSKCRVLDFYLDPGIVLQVNSYQLLEA